MIHSAFYSVRNDFTGFDLAALNASSAMVKIAREKINMHIKPIKPISTGG
jgi:hypothetical protein